MFVEIMDVRDGTHIIHSCHAAGWDNLPGMKSTF